jgi:hypothetical protein
MTYADLDALKSTWQSLNRTLDRQHSLALHQFREKKLHRFRTGFRPLVIGQIIQIMCGGLLALVAGSFWVNHLGVVHLMVYGISVHLFAITLIVFAARDLYLVRRFDYAAPVLVLQKQIADLRDWHLRAGLWFGVAGCFIWIPLLLIIFQGLGADVWRRNPVIVSWLLVSGLICLGVLYGNIAWSRRPGGEKFAKNLEDSSAGCSVKRAQSLLDEIRRFEQE